MEGRSESVFTCVAVGRTIPDACASICAASSRLCSFLHSFIISDLTKLSVALRSFRFASSCSSFRASPSVSKASFARGCVHLSGCTSNDICLYFLLMSSSHASKRTPRCSYGLSLKHARMRSTSASRLTSYTSLKKDLSSMSLFAAVFPLSASATELVVVAAVPPATSLAAPEVVAVAVVSLRAGNDDNAISLSLRGEEMMMDGNREEEEREGRGRRSSCVAARNGRLR